MDAKSLSKIFFTNTFFGFLKQGITAIIAIFLIPFLIFNIGAITFGEYILLQLFTINGLFSYADFGITGSVVRYLTKYYTLSDSREFKKIFSSYFFVFFFIGVFFCLATYLSIDLIADIFFKNSENLIDIKKSLPILSIMLVLNIPTFVIKSFFSSVQKIWIVKIWEILYSILFAINIVFFTTYNFSFYNIFLLDLFINFLLVTIFLIVGLLFYKKYFIILPRYFDFKILKNTSEFSLYMFINKLIGLITNKSPQLIIGAFFSANYLTYYTLITKFPFLIKQLMGVLNSAVLPIAVSLRSEKRFEEIIQFLNFGTKISIILNFPIAIYLMIYADSILEIWVGSEYIFLSPSLSIMLLWIAINTISSFFSSMYNDTNQLKTILPVSLISILIFLLFISLAVLNKSFIYVPLSFLFSSLFNCFCSVLLLNKTFRISPISYMKNVSIYYLWCISIILLFHYFAFLLNINVNIISLFSIFAVIMLINILLLIKDKHFSYFLK